RQRKSAQRVEVAVVLVPENRARDVRAMSRCGRADPRRLRERSDRDFERALVAERLGERDVLVKSSSELRRDARFRKIVAPVWNETGVDDGDVDAAAGLRKVFRVDEVGVPRRIAAGGRRQTLKRA